MTKISAVIIASNEARNIVRCIRSVIPVADEVLVYVNNSMDKTFQLAEEQGATVITGSWEGYAETKNKANRAALHDWILSLDADEELSIKLQQSLLAWKEKIPVNASICRLTNYCGTFIFHCGWYPEYKWRIFNRKHTVWRGAIHEHLHQDAGTVAPTIKLIGDCYHYSYYTTTEHVLQSEKFAKLAATDLFKRGKRSSFLKRFAGPFFKFITMYVFRLGFLDGKHGYLVCKISAQAISMRERYLNQLNARHAGLT